MVAPLKVGNGNVISSYIYWAYDELSMLGLKLKYFSKRAHASLISTGETILKDAC